MQSSGTPGPESDTRISTVFPAGTAVIWMGPAWAAYRSAFRTRLQRARSRRAGSARTERSEGEFEPERIGWRVFDLDSGCGCLRDNHILDPGFGADFRLGKREQFVEEVGHVADLFPDIVQVAGVAGVAALFQDAESHLHAGQRGAQLMGDVAEEPFLA